MYRFEYVWFTYQPHILQLWHWLWTQIGHPRDDMKRKPQCWQKGEPILRGTGKEWQSLKKKIMRNTARRQSFVSGSLKSAMHTMKSSPLKSKHLHLRVLHVRIEKARETLYLNVDGWHFRWSLNTCHGDAQIYGVGRKIAVWPTSGRDLCQPTMKNIWMHMNKILEYHFKFREFSIHQKNTK